MGCLWAVVMTLAAIAVVWGWYVLVDLIKKGEL